SQIYTRRWNGVFILGLILIFFSVLNLIRVYFYPSGTVISRWISYLANTSFFSVILLVLGVICLLVARERYRRHLNIIRRREALAVRAAKEAQYRSGPIVTAIGGGTGLSTILRGLKRMTSNANAIVTVTDDGGSSGRLISGSDALPPGDIRNCLVALSPREGTLERLFNYRLEKPDELKGHCLGNLLISGLAEMEGDMAAAVWEIGRILNIRGKVIPVTMDKVILVAQMDDGAILRGETSIVKDSRGIKRVFLEPEVNLVNSDAIDAIMDADIILLGPGSLYTSIIPNLLVPGIIDALSQSPAPVYYVANMMTQAGETDGYNLSDHIEAIVSLCPRPFLDGVIINTGEISQEMLTKYRQQGLGPVENDMRVVNKLHLKCISLPLVKEEKIVKHDAEVLADFIAKGIY
ncbi:MAG: uridine diphosphate-N-acetylglucosamine-binding protein YvcK, partial [Bacillota bacterium]|nr:uridine diphosphate-N-acetylglucosamine-binding protein YvcK [Bacillota bacterium]